MARSAAVAVALAACLGAAAAAMFCEYGNYYNAVYNEVALPASGWIGVDYGRNHSAYLGFAGFYGSNDVAYYVERGCVVNGTNYMPESRTLYTTRDWYYLEWEYLCPSSPYKVYLRFECRIVNGCIFYIGDSPYCGSFCAWAEPLSAETDKGAAAVKPRLRPRPLVKQGAEWDEAKHRVAA